MMLHSSHESKAFKNPWLLDLSGGMKALTLPSSLSASSLVTPSLKRVANHVKANIQKPGSTVQTSDFSMRFMLFNRLLIGS